MRIIKVVAPLQTRKKHSVDPHLLVLIPLIPD